MKKTVQLSGNSQKCTAYIQRHVKSESPSPLLQLMQKPSQCSNQPHKKMPLLLPLISSQNTSLSQQKKQQRHILTTFRNKVLKPEYSLIEEIKQSSGKRPEFEQVNKSILKRIEQKIYPINKDMAKKLKLRKKYSCQTLDNYPESTQTNQSNFQIQSSMFHKNKKKHKKSKQSLESLLDYKLNLTNRPKRTKSQQQFINLQVKVQVYLNNQRKKLSNKENHTQKGLNYSDASQKNSLINNQNFNSINLKNTKNIIALKKKKIEKSVESSLLRNQSELKRVLKIFQERKNNFTTLETQKEKSDYQQINNCLFGKDDPKDFDQSLFVEDFSKSIKNVSSSFNKRPQEVKPIQDITFRVNNQSGQEFTKQQDFKQTVSKSQFLSKKSVKNFSKQNMCLKASALNLKSIKDLKASKSIQNAQKRLIRTIEETKKS